MDLALFPRRRYTTGITPLDEARRFSTDLGGPRIYIKRDDLLGLAGGGNKTRKLEFLVAEAIDEGVDTLITCGALQSNHCRLTLAAAVKEGLKCRLILEEREPGSFDADAGGNVFLFRLLGAEKIRVVPSGSDMTAVMQEEAHQLAREGRRAYIIPTGGSNPVGAMGYVACAEEILAQTFDMGLRIDHVLCASGSTGTHAGLVTGFYGNSSRIRVIGINVIRTKEEQEPLVHDLARRTAERLGVPSDIPRDAVCCFGEYVGPGYSLPTPEMANAVKMLARTEGILLDPVYTGKAMAGLIDLVRKGFFNSDETLLFLHTGGSPALYVYMSDILE